MSRNKREGRYAGKLEGKHYRVVAKFRSDTYEWKLPGNDSAFIGWLHK
jgi:hypothetical protein